MKILAIETSCDETAIAVLECKGSVKSPRFKILSNVVSSQVKLHAKWGGVVPSLAKREHQISLIPVLKMTLKEAGLLELRNPSSLKLWRTSKNYKSGSIDGLEEILEREPNLLEQFLKFIPKIKIPKIETIAVTMGPGLEPALWTGINFAKALSVVWDKPLMLINHMEGHLFSPLLKEGGRNNFQMPAIALLVSGGHTELVLIKEPLKYKIIGQTRDDAVGEAFDKVARMLGLGYPGGPAISEQALKWKSQITNSLKGEPRALAKSQTNPNSQIPNKFPKGRALGFSQIQLPRPMINSKDFDFSFSGLKTAVLYAWKKTREGKIYKIRDREKYIQSMCYEFQQATIDVLVSKILRATEEYKPKTIILGGGVTANKELRKQLKQAINNKFPKTELLLPDIKFTGDNAAMIAMAACFRMLSSGPAKKKRASQTKADGNLSL